MNVAAAILILASGITLTVGDIIMKMWIETEKTSLYALGLSVYLIGLIFLANSFRYEHIAEATIAVFLANVITLLIVSYFMYGEKLQLLDYVGITLGIAAFLILEYRTHA